MVCENWKDEPFPNAALVMQELCDKGRKFSNTCSQEVPGWMRDSHHFLTFLCDRSLMKCVLRTRLHTSLRTRPHHVLRFIALTIKPQGECQLRLSSPSIERHAVTRKLRYLGTRHDAVLLATAELLRCPESKPLALFWQVYEVKHINWKSLLNLIGKALATIICFYHNQKENLWVSLIPWRVRLASNAGVPLFRPGEKTQCLFIYYCTLKRAAMDFAFLCELMASR